MQRAGRRTIPRNDFARVVLLILMTAVIGPPVAHADVTGVTLTCAPADAGAIYNGGQVFTLSAAWSAGDTPPFAATFSKGGGTGTGQALGTSNVGASPATFHVSGAALGPGPAAFSVSVIETAVPNARPGTANGGNVTIDLTAPVITIEAITPTEISGNAPNNVITFTVRSTKPLRAAPTVVIVPGGPGQAELPANPVGTPVVPGTSFNYSFTNSMNLPSGQYTIRARGKDTTLPEPTANEGVGQGAFSVDATAPGAPQINTSTPPSPSSLSGLTLRGSCADDCASITVTSDQGQSFSSTAANGQWSVSATGLGEGSRTFTAIGADRYNNLTPRSAPFTVAIDLTPPQVASLIQYRTPTAETNVTIRGINAIDPQAGTPAVNSPPVYVTLLKNGAPLGASVAAALDGTFSFANVPLDGGDNFFSVICADSARGGTTGNQSRESAQMRVFRDVNRPRDPRLEIGRAPMASASVPTQKWLCPGTYNLQVTFTERMATDTNPTIFWTPAGGAELSNNQGTWLDLFNFVGRVEIPVGQGGSVDGIAQQLRITGAKDEAGNDMDPFVRPQPFRVDTTAPTTTFDSMNTLYANAAQPSVLVKGFAEDAHSGIGFVRLYWEAFDNPLVNGSMTVPIFTTPPPARVEWERQLPTGTLAGKYKLWAFSGDQAEPSANIETRNPTGYRILIVDVGRPVISRISLDDMVTDIPPSPPTFTVASDIGRISAVMADVGSAGIDFSRVSSATFVLRDPNRQQIYGNYSNNGSDTIFFNFPVLTVTGTYTIDLDVWDLAGNQADHASRTFMIKKTPPSHVRFDPSNGRYCTATEPCPLARDRVEAFIVTANGTPDPQASLTSSTMEVTYNGTIVGQASAAADRLVWDMYGPTDALYQPGTIPDQRRNGRYNVTVIPRDIFGNTGLATSSFFYYDSQAPVAFNQVPGATSGDVNPPFNIQAPGGAPWGPQNWIGPSTRALTAVVSDKPADATRYATAPLALDPVWQNGTGSGILTPAVVQMRVYRDSGLVVLDQAQLAGLGIAPSLSFTEEQSVGNLSIPFSQAIFGGSASGANRFDIDVALTDRASYGGPNVATRTWSYVYDWIPPEITLAEPKAPAKYCGTRVPLMASFTDHGIIDFIDVDPGNGTFIREVSNVGTSSVTWASGTHWADISKVPEGQPSIRVRATDMAGNAGLATITITIDRTPPGPPTLIAPYNNAYVNNRGQRFRWSSVTDANRYLFQISDTAGFQSVLNDPTPNDGIIGEITSMSEAAFSVPRDGTYYWRVASIEDCNDGSNIGSFSLAWRFSVDTVKPQILEISPTPSTGNKITTGMVTFTIRFSEAMDTTKVPTVSITSAGGQYMLIEQIRFLENTWTGTTVIPKNNSALYDGNAVISVAGATDLAGNIMENDATHYVVINTGPAFDTMMFSNPGHESEVMLVVRATENLQAPPTVSVTQGQAPVPVAMYFLKERFYAGAYQISLEHPGKAYIDLTGTDLQGNVGHQSVQFTVADLNPTASVRTITPDRLAVIDVPAGAVARRGGMFVLPRQAGDNVAAARRANVLEPAVTGPSANSELVEICGLETLGPVGIAFRRAATYTARLRRLDLRGYPPERVHLYRQVGNTWVFQGGRLDGDVLTAPLGGGGRLAAMIDSQAPRLLSVRPGNDEILDDPRPTFEARFADQGSGLDPASVTVLIDNVIQTGLKTEMIDGILTWQPTQPLSKGRHAIAVLASDRAGNVTRAEFQVVAPGPFAIDQFAAFPNPTRNQAVWFSYDVGQAADELRLRIYDVRGHKVAEFDDFDFPHRARGRVRWDLTNDGGQRVANGVYLYKLEATKNGNKTKQTGKLAVLR